MSTVLIHERICGMLRNSRIFFIALSILFLCAGIGNALGALEGGKAPGESTSRVIDELSERFAHPEPMYWPELRWWLAAGYHTDETLTRNVRLMAESGFGAAELIARGDPQPKSVYSWGSDEWTSDTRLLIAETTKRGLGFSITSGTNWGTANLPDTYTWEGRKFDYDNRGAAKELNLETVYLAAGETYKGELPAPDLPERVADAGSIELMGVVAGRVIERPGTEGEGLRKSVTSGALAFETIDLTGTVTEKSGTYSLEWTAPADGEYGLFVFWMHGTGHTAEPSVSTNYTINYFDTYGVEALIDYFEEVILTPELKKTIAENGRGEIYMDSLEQATSADASMYWGYQFKDRFMENFGYDITPYLPFLACSSSHGGAGSKSSHYYEAGDHDGQDREFIAKVRSDYYLNLTKMYVENTLNPLREWLHSLNMTLRAEPSYGQLLEISLPAKGLDDVETESLAFTTSPDLYRGLLGGAHIYNRLFSSETGAINGGNYRFGLEYFMQMSYLQFAAGVQRTVYHGYAGIEGPDTIDWPGWEGMEHVISTRFNVRQPSFRHYRDYTTMIARNQKVLRQGVPRVDLAILRTDYDYPSYGRIFTDQDFMEKNNLMNDTATFWKDLSLQGAGYTYEYFSPLILRDEANIAYGNGLLQPDGPGYRAVILYQEAMDLKSAGRLLQMARKGLPVVFVNNVSESVKTYADITHGQAASVTLSANDTDEELAAIVKKIKSLPNTRTVEKQKDTLPALQELGVYPRVAFTGQNRNILTAARYDKPENRMYVYAYNYKFDADTRPFSFEMTLDAAGKPYLLDDWTGGIREAGVYTVNRNKTTLPLTLEPGESTIVVLDMNAAGAELHPVATDAPQIVKSGGGWAVLSTTSGTFTTRLSDGGTGTATVSVDPPILLRKWDLSLEDWNRGEKQIITETQFGHTTEEYYYETKKTVLAFRDIDLVPWKDLPATADQLAELDNPAGSSMSDVSGIGRYSTTFEWNGAASGAFLSIESVNGNSAAVYVNGRKASPLNLRTLTVDISDLLVKGTNTLEIEVASTLVNRLRTFESWGEAWNASFGNPMGYPEVQDYGMTGAVSIVPYAVEEITEQAS